MKYRLVMFGAPGAGKGTQSSFLVKKYGLRHISTGEMLRAAMKAGTPLGRKVQGFVNAGKLVPDEVVLELVKEEIGGEESSGEFLLDGFPRTIHQAQMLDEMLLSMRQPLSAVLSLEVPKSLLIDRLVGRRLCAICGGVFHVSSLKDATRCPDDGSALEQREDDREEAVQIRLSAFEEQTLPLKKYYQKRRLLQVIDGSKDVSEVSAEIEANLGSLSERENSSVAV